MKGAKKLVVPPLSGQVETLPLADISARLGTMEAEAIGECPWPRFPYRPWVNFQTAHMSTAICLKFNVREQAVRALVSGGGGAVGDDSCVEFFVAPAAGDYYYNFEFNCQNVEHRIDCPWAG